LGPPKSEGTGGREGMGVRSEKTMGKSKRGKTMKRVGRGGRFSFSGELPIGLSRVGKIVRGI